MRSRAYFLPGYACTADIWRPCASTLADRFDTVALSWPADLTRDFHTVSHFSDWLQEEIHLAPADALIGHSLGGLVALEVARRSGLPDVRVVLVESFLTPPHSFFKNLLMPSAPRALVAEVSEMLDRERPKYSTTLREHLASLDLSAEVEHSPARIDSLYGDRGHSAAEVTESLGWSKQLQRRINIHIVPKACHFPMLEQQVATAQIIRSILDA